MVFLLPNARIFPHTDLSLQGPERSFATLAWPLETEAFSGGRPPLGPSQLSDSNQFGAHTGWLTRCPKPYCPQLARGFSGTFCLELTGGSDSLGLFYMIVLDKGGARKKVAPRASV